MIIGCTRERKNHEYRVGLTPSNALAYIQAGHTVLMERGAGTNSGFQDAEYSAQGAEILQTAEEVCGRSKCLSRSKNRNRRSSICLEEG